MTLARLLRRLALALVLICVIGLLVTAASVWWVARQDDRRRSDAIVVLGASQFDGRPSPVFIARLSQAATLYAERVAPRVITVGGNRPGDRFTEAAAGRSWLLGRGLPSARVLAVPTGSDTLTSLRAVAAQMRRRGWHSAVLVTDPWHSLRARRMARDSELDAVTSPARSGPVVQTRAAELRYIARETLAVVYYTIFRKSSDAGPDAF